MKELPKIENIYQSHAFVRGHADKYEIAETHHISDVVSLVEFRDGTAALERAGASTEAFSAIKHALAHCAEDALANPDFRLKAVRAIAEAISAANSIAAPESGDQAGLQRQATIMSRIHDWAAELAVGTPLLDVLQDVRQVCDETGDEFFPKVLKTALPAAAALDTNLNWRP